MNIIDVNTADLPVDPIHFEPIATNNYPFCLLGFQIKNKYDQMRHKIPKDFKSADIIHLLHFPTTSVLFFRGIQATPTSKLHKFLDHLTTSRFSILTDTTTTTYEKLLKEHGLTGETCINNFRPGVYPIDSKFASVLIKENINLTELYQKIFSDEEIPYFQSIGYITLYVLDKVGSTLETPESFFEKIISNYKNSTAEH